MSSSTSSDGPGARYDTPFFDEAELRAIDAFEERGYLLFDIVDRDGVGRLQKFVADCLAERLATDYEDATAFLDGAHEHIDVGALNEVRLSIIHALAAETWVRPLYHSLARSALAAIVGNELSMQRRVNLSIQLPNDDSSLLPVHSDVWSGDSPYEVVVWIPLVDCRRTKSMYLLPRAAHDVHAARMSELRDGSAEDLFAEIEKDVVWLDVPFGKGLLFTHTLMHGNRVNVESETRWSMNCRFKSALSPYDDKRLGEFFEPITIRPATRLGAEYRLPEGFED